MNDDQVLILGAGPVGLTLANELTRFGIRPRIIDKAAGIREVSKAMILHVRTQEVLDRVQIAGRLPAESQALREVVVHAYGKHIGSWDLDHLDSAYRHPVIIGQNRTQHLLLDHLNRQGVSVEWSSEATSFELDALGATTVVRSTDPRTGKAADARVRSRYVVGCEGPTASCVAGLD